MTRSMNVRAGGGTPLICVPSAEDLFGGWFYDNRSASRVINHRQRIDKRSQTRDRSESRVMKIDEKTTRIRDRSASRVATNQKGGCLKSKKWLFVQQIHENKHMSWIVTGRSAGRPDMRCDGLLRHTRRPKRKGGASLRSYRAKVWGVRRATASYFYVLQLLTFTRYSFLLLPFTASCFYPLQLLTDKLFLKCKKL